MNSNDFGTGSWWIRVLQGPKTEPRHFPWLAALPDRNLCMIDVFKKINKNSMSTPNVN